MTYPHAGGRAGTTDMVHKLVILGVVLGALSVLFNVLTAVPALVLGAVGVVRGDRLGWLAIVLAVVGTIVNVVLGFVLLGAIWEALTGSGAEA